MKKGVVRLVEVDGVDVDLKGIALDNKTRAQQIELVRRAFPGQTDQWRKNCLKRFLEVNGL